MPNKLPPPFVTGATYLDREGEYLVTGTTGEDIEFERPDGRKERRNARLKANIHCNMLGERNTPPVSSRQNVRGVGSWRTKDGILEQMYVFIAEIIEEQSKGTYEYVLHDQIVDALTTHEYAGPLLKQRSERETDGFSAEWFASDYVAFYSKEWTEGRPRYADRLERKKVIGKWAYRVRQ